MDKYAQRSQELAVASQESGFFDREIVPVTLPDGTVVAKDDGPRASSTLEKLSELKPAFREDGKVTAGNSCPLNDGAAAVLVMSDTRAKELGLKPRARIVAAATAALEPELMGVAPIGAIKKVLDRAGMTIDDVDVVELNEAFAAQVIPIMSECDIPLEKMNPHGGAIALGHPFGMTGRAHHDHAAERPRDRRQDDRPRDDVRRRRPGPGDDRRAPELAAQRANFARAAGPRSRLTMDIAGTPRMARSGTPPQDLGTDATSARTRLRALAAALATLARAGSAPPMRAPLHGTPLDDRLTGTPGRGRDPRPAAATTCCSGRGGADRLHGGPGDDRHRQPA